jgi:hypothetical protein
LAATCGTSEEGISGTTGSCLFLERKMKNKNGTPKKRKKNRFGFLT